ncbi:hypothetical protein TI39_contig364g00012 [Zymoseptoria brevis]|uniref:Uncharacterized protein n=1 Tax=Zymoseptoria brevis TaxID=1047168 RepID=A0A0F4GPC6_9PEZI|nr:hypothetical protein TI39_contig364g00012 [Zymoseptoria brevis]
MDQTRRAPPRDPSFAAIEPALKVGAACGGVGFLFGGAAGIVRGAPGFLFASASAIQTFAIGSTFTAVRLGIIHAWTTESRPTTPLDRTKASAIAGGFTGGLIGFITRGRSNAIPGAIMFTLFGAGGQHVYNKWTAAPSAEPKKNFWRRMSDKSWTPFKVLTNEEYAEMLKEKMLKLDVEIAIIDDKIAGLKEQQRNEKQVPTSHPFEDKDRSNPSD